METFLLTWNPDAYPFHELGTQIAKLNRRGSLDDRWSIGNTNRIRFADRVFLMRQGSDRPGIVASGHVTRERYFDADWAGSDRQRSYVDLEWDALLPIEKRLPKGELPSSNGKWIVWNAQSSGMYVPSPTAARLERIWRDHIGREPAPRPARLAEEVTERYWEGSRIQVYVNKYERDPRARNACLRAHGYRCHACDQSLEDIYGPMARQYIHVHHIKPLSRAQGRRKIDPIKDLVPVCPNCHMMLHLSSQPMSIEQLRAAVRAQRRAV